MWFLYALLCQVFCKGPHVVEIVRTIVKLYSVKFLGALYARPKENHQDPVEVL